MADDPNQSGEQQPQPVAKEQRPDGTSPPIAPVDPKALGASPNVASGNQPARDYNTNAWGPTPIMTSGMTFHEVGSSGLRQFSGWVREEYLEQLVGRQGAQKYREMQDNSPVIGGIMFAIISTMRKVEWRVEPVNDSGPAQEAADFVESCMHDMSITWEDHTAEALSMLAFGYAPHEIVYKKRLGTDPPDDPDRPGKRLPSSNYDDGKIGWRRIPLRGQDTILKWFFDENGQVQGVTQQPWVGQIVDIPIEKMLLFRPTFYKGNPEGRSVLRNSYTSYWYVKRLQEMEAIIGERMGGIPVMSVPLELIQAAQAGDSQAQANYENFKNMARNIRVDEQMGVVLPSNTYSGVNGPSNVRMYTFELVAPGGGSGGKSSMDFDKTITRYNVMMMTSVLADFLQLGHESRGTQSLAVSKVDMFFQAIEGFLNAMGAVYNRYALPRLFRLNGMSLDLIPEIKPDLAQRVDLDVLSNFILRLSQAGFPLFPNDELQSYILDAAGLPDIDDDLALQAAGMLPEQLDRDEERADVMLDNLKNPPTPPIAGKKPPGMTPMQKMVAAGIARRMIRMSGPRFGITTRKRAHTHVRKRRIFIA